VESQFEKYLLCESQFDASAKKDVASTVNGYLASFKKDAMQTIRDRLENVQRIEDYTKVGDAIDTELSRLNAEYITKLTEFLNTRKI
jgi:uncharacterized protein YdbL (DUF1318 family)